jgi:hypothetical protein
LPYATQFEYEYNEAYPESLGLGSRRFRVRFARRDYAGAVTVLLPGGSPYKESNSDNSDSRFTALNPWKFSFDLACQDYWDAASFYVNDDTELRVSIEIDETGAGTAYQLHRIGFVSDADLKEPYGPKPYIVSITGICGLALLKKFPLLDAAGKRLQGKPSLAQILRTGLALTGNSLDLVTGTNLYASHDMAPGQAVNGHADPGVCPLYQSLVDNSWLINDSGEVRTAWDVLSSAIESIPSLQLSQNKGKWWVTRSDERGGGWDVGADKTATSMHIRGYSDTNPIYPPNSHESIELGILVNSRGATRVHEGDQLLLAKQTGVKVEQGFGRHLSILPNGDLSQVDSTGLPAGFVTNNLATANRFRVGTGTNADPYAIRIYDCGDEKINRDTPYVAVSINFNPASPQYTRFQHRTLKFKARLNNLRAAKVYVVAERDNAPYIYVQSGFVKGTYVPGANGQTAVFPVKIKDSVATLFYNTYTDQANHVKAKPGLFDCSFDLGEIDRVSNLTLFFCSGECLDHYGSDGRITGPETGQDGNRPYLEYSDLQVVSEQKGYVLNGIQRVMNRPGQLVPDTTVSLSLGDVPDAAGPYDRSGTLYGRIINAEAAATTSWYYPDANILAPNPTGRDVGKPLIQWVAESRAGQNLKVCQSWDGTLLGRLPNGLHTCIRFSDIGETVGGTFVPYAFAITRISDSDVRTMMHRVSLTRIMTPATSAEFPAKRDYQTPDGLIPIVDETSEKAGDTGAGYLSEKDKLVAQLVGEFLQNPVPRPITPPFGFVPVQPGSIHFSADVYNNGQKIGSILGSVRKAILLHYPH